MENNVVDAVQMLKKEVKNIIKNTIEAFSKEIDWKVIDEFYASLDRRLREYAKNIGLQDAYIEDFDVIFEVNEEERIVFHNLLEEFL